MINFVKILLSRCVCVCFFFFFFFINFLKCDVSAIKFECCQVLIIKHKLKKSNIVFSIQQKGIHPFI